MLATLEERLLEWLAVAADRADNLTEVSQMMETQALDRAMEAARNTFDPHLYGI